MNDVKKTQHFSKNENLLYNISFSPANAVDPFAGDLSLASHFSNTSWEFYDIEPKGENVIRRDSLLNPIDYSGKTVITNPPYLSSSNTKEFREVFSKYNTNDLYKASILSILGCENGVLIIPLNFFLDENSSGIRKKFLSRYKVSYVNYFTQPMFENTTYNVCSFYFEKGKTDSVEFHDFFKNKSFSLTLEEKYGYRIGGEFFSRIEKIKPIFSKSLGKKPNTNIFANCLDKRNERLGLKYVEGLDFIGKESDRIFMGLDCNRNITESEQKQLVEKFNSFINAQRNKYNNLLLTNFRDFGRKRISLKNVYKICTMLYNEMEEKNGK